MDTWLIMHLPNQIYVWNLGTMAGTDLDDAIMAARTFAGFPANDTWPFLTDSVDEFVAPGIPPRRVRSTSLMVTTGMPHEKLMARATVGPDLTRVSPEQIAEYRAEYAANARQAQLGSALATLVGLHPDDLAAVLDHPQVVRRRDSDDPLD